MPGTSSAHYEQEDDYERWQVPHAEFHRGLTSPAGARINTLLAQLFAHGERYRRLWVHSAPNPWRVAEHRALLDACQAGDAILPRRLMAQHIAQTTVDILAEHHPDYAPQRLEETLAAARL